MSEQETKHCDFCYAEDPGLVWQVKDGGTVEVYGQRDGAPPEKLVSDHDGLWAVCDPCDEAIRKFHKGKQDNSAVRRFVKGIWGRTTSDLLSQVPPEKRERAASAIRKQQISLFTELLPQLGNPRSVDEVVADPQSAIKKNRTVLSPGYIPDGATRLRPL